MALTSSIAVSFMVTARVTSIVTGKVLRWQTGTQLLLFNWVYPFCIASRQTVCVSAHLSIKLLRPSHQFMQTMLVLDLQGLKTYALDFVTEILKDWGYDQGVTEEDLLQALTNHVFRDRHRN